MTGRTKIIPCNNCRSTDHMPLTRIRGSENFFNEKFFTVVLCKKCALGFINPQPSHEDYARYYAGLKSADTASGLDKLFLKKNYQKHYAQWFTHHAGLPKEARILEIGSGRGVLLHFLKELGYHNVAGLEISQRAAQAAREQFGLEVHNQDFFKHILPREYFDAVIAMAMLEHMTDPAETVREIMKLLKPGGILYLVTPDICGMSFRKIFFKFIHTYYFSADTLSSIVEQAGCKIISSLATPRCDNASNLLFPDNSLAGELHILAKKEEKQRDALLRTAPFKEDCEKILRLYRKTRWKDWPYQLAHRIIFTRFSSPIRRLRHLKKIRAVFRKESAYDELDRFFAGKLY